MLIHPAMMRVQEYCATTSRNGRSRGMSKTALRSKGCRFSEPEILTGEVF